MLNLPQALIDAFKSKISFTAILLEMYLIDTNDNPYNLYFTDLDEDIYYNNKIYKSYPFKINEFNYSIGARVDNLSITFDNVSLLPVSLFLNKEQRGREVVLLFSALDNNGNVIGAFEVFRGFINKITIKEQSKTSVATIEITHELALWNKETLRLQTYKCPWRFKDVNCGYNGTETWCDKTYERCLQLGNTPNFGGFPHLADIEGKEIWWGRKPK